MKILIIEDDTKVADYIKNGSLEYDHVIEVAHNGKDGLLSATTEKYDVIIVDRMIPEMDGLTVIKTMRTAGNKTPVLILSALGEVDDRVKGLRSGGDDYLVKPFAFSELLARIEVLARRNVSTVNEETKLIVRDLEMDLLSRKVTRNGKTLDIQPREFKLLEYLMRHKGQIVTRTMFLENVWEYHFDPQTNIIDVHISRLRSKVEADSENPLIRTIRGAGYIVED